MRSLFNQKWLGRWIHSKTNEVVFQDFQSNYDSILWDVDKWKPCSIKNDSHEEANMWDVQFNISTFFQGIMVSVTYREALEEEQLF